MSVILKTPSNGSVTLAEQDTASDVVVTVPAVTATLLNNSSGVMNIGSGQVYKDASGNVGIGTSSPSTKLHISGTSGAGDLSGSIRVENQSYTSGSYAGVLFQTADALNSYVTAVRQASFGGILAFGTNDGTNTTSIVERARIDSSGNLLVGTTVLSPTTTAGSIMRSNGVAQFTANSTQALDVGRIGSTGAMVAFFYGATNVGTITTNGTSTGYNTTSDYRLKENVAPMQNALATVAALKPCTYTWKADGSAGQGFIAHELQAVVPDCVTGEKDAVETVDDLDADGKKIGTKEVPRYQGVDTSFLVATLVSAIQEQQAIITQLQADVAALQGAA